MSISGGFGDAADQALQKAFENVAREAFAAMQQSFTAKAWDWPDDLPTRKLKGATLAEKIRSYRNGDGLRAGSPRNIIDVGSLRQSGTWEMTGPLRATFRWSANYATAVHEGARIHPWGNKRRTVTLPARPWTSAVLGRVKVPGIEPFPLKQRLRDVWVAEFRRQRGR